MSKNRLITNQWESEQEIADRTGVELEIVNHALKSLAKENLVSCLWPETTEKPFRWRLRTES